MAIDRRPVPLALLREARRQRAGRLRRARQKRWEWRMRRLRRAVGAVIAIALVTIAVGLIMPGGLPDNLYLLAMLSAFVAFCLLAVYPASPKPKIEDLEEADLGELAATTELWLEGRRNALPSPALDAVDIIGVRLEQLAPQLETLDPAAPASREVRKLLTEHLPGLVNSYTRIPSSLRAQEHAGSTPAAQLTEGLHVIAKEIEAMSLDLSRNDLDALAVRGRFLETKYIAAPGS
ncbi:hypothetical protein [Novosphingobium sp. 9U]|uniref:hypothetical protein n=1 Tax=Novosphingobium sp. 9U TaxID=2653158 RepID=UPI0012F36C51|nr:hypothetical protein [Novosphingobium sp. 9U]VWX51574.1 conserved hypothetical protein [Novosphingobium sp. 9U]